MEDVVKMVCPTTNLTPELSENDNYSRNQKQRLEYTAEPSWRAS